MNKVGTDEDRRTGKDGLKRSVNKKDQPYQELVDAAVLVCAPWTHVNG